ncbi:DUF2968 domain-containing protein [Paraburkholderia acidipaludis]|uniref:DUF2968 domain-containing protein n=1 Tax=Paraburkholderia acidipaludis TaxID=660537 RepID=UPI000694FB66|nr:DUF2968 domain-containing protein [Paraburkholderia acidipaludis]
MDNLVKLHRVPAEADTADQTQNAGPEGSHLQPVIGIGDRIGRLHAVPVTRARPDYTNIVAASIEEVERLETAAALLTFRQYCSFDYAATLYFHSDERNFYTTLHVDNRLWRASKTAIRGAAEAEFQYLVNQVTRLAEEEAQRAELAAENAQITRSLSEAEAQLERVHSDVRRNAELKQEVANRRQEAHTEIGRLKAQRMGAHAQLGRAQRLLQQIGQTHAKAIRRFPGRGD